MPNFCINFLNKAEKSLPILYDFAVASLADAWIKMQSIPFISGGKMSHPSRMRGLKCVSIQQEPYDHEVASLADAWIKMQSIPFISGGKIVASLADAWIKICIYLQM